MPSEYIKIGVNWNRVRTKEHYLTTLKRSKGIYVYDKDVGRPVPRDKLQAEYKFEENALDTSGNGFHGTANNISYADGNVGKCAVFNQSLGSTIHVNSLAPYFANRNVVTVAFRFKTQDPNGYFFATSSDSLNNFNTFMIHMYGSKLWVERAGEFTTKVSSANNYNDNAWHLYVITYDGSTITLNVDNGKEIVTASSTFPITTYSAKIGTNYFNSGDIDYTGYIDQFRVYDRIIKKFEIDKLYYENLRRVLI